MTGQRLYRCHLCHWRGWNAKADWPAVKDGRLVQPPPKRATIGLARHDRHNGLDLDALDALVPPADERT